MKYFDKQKNIITINDIQSSKIQILFKNNDIKEILCVDKIDSQYFKTNHENLLHETDQKLYLEGFKLIQK